MLYSCIHMATVGVKGLGSSDYTASSLSVYKLILSNGYVLQRWLSGTRNECSLWSTQAERGGLCMLDAPLMEMQTISDCSALC